MRKEPRHLIGVGSGDPLFLDGGIQLWGAEGRPLTAEATPVSRGTLRVKPDLEKLRPFCFAPSDGGYYAMGDRLAQSYSIGKKD